MRDAEYGVDLPLASLAPGPYLLRFTATMGDQNVTRQVRFEVVP